MFGWGSQGGEEEVVDVEGDGPSFDDFDWCPQRRARVASLLRGQTALHGKSQSINKKIITKLLLKLNINLNLSKHLVKLQFFLKIGSQRDSDGPHSPDKESPANTSGDSGSSGGGAGGSGSSAGEAMEKEMEGLREKIRILERDGQNNNPKFHCLVCRVS